MAPHSCPVLLLSLPPFCFPSKSPEPASSPQVVLLGEPISKCSLCPFSSPASPSPPLCGCTGWLGQVSLGFLGSRHFFPSQLRCVLSLECQGGYETMVLGSLAETHSGQETLVRPTGVTGEQEVPTYCCLRLAMCHPLQQHGAGPFTQWFAD